MSAVAAWLLCVTAPFIFYRGLRGRYGSLQYTAKRVGRRTSKELHQAVT